MYWGYYMFRAMLSVLSLHSRSSSHTIRFGGSLKVAARGCVHGYIRLISPACRSQVVLFCSSSALKIHVMHEEVSDVSKIIDMAGPWRPALQNSSRHGVLLSERKRKFRSVIFGCPWDLSASILRPLRLPLYVRGSYSRLLDRKFANITEVPQARSSPCIIS